MGGAKIRAIFTPRDMRRSVVTPWKRSVTLARIPRRFVGWNADFVQS